MKSLNLDLLNMGNMVRGLADDQRMAMCESMSGYIDFNIRSAEADAGILSRKASGQLAENNAVRQHLLNALKLQFNVQNVMQLPQSVRDALKVGTMRDDLKLDAQGMVTSGRPLTARRIRAVIAAVKRELATAYGTEVAQKDYAEVCRVRGADPKPAVFNYFVAQAQKLPDQVLAAFDGGVTVDSLLDFGRKFHAFEQSLYRHMPLAVHEAAQGGDGEVWRLVMLEAAVGKMTTEVRAALHAFVNTDACVEGINAHYDELNSPELTDKQTRELSSALSYATMLRLAVAKFDGFIARDL